MRARSLIIGSLLLLSSCGEQELYSKLSEQQVNEMIAVLQTAGIEATKTSKDGERWSIGAPDKDFSRAIEVLKQQGYPREDYSDLGKVFKKEGFVSSPLEERARLNYSLSQDLSRTLSTIDGVVVARVHLAMPQIDPLSEEEKPSSASVFIKYRMGVDVEKHIGEVKALVVNSIEGMTYDNVTVVMVPSQPWPSRSVPRSPVTQGATMLWIAIPTLAMLLASALISHWRAARRTGKSVVPVPETQA